MTREELLALADELEGMDCRTCPADGTKDCRDLPCEARFIVANCPMCGRKLEERRQ